MTTQISKKLGVLGTLSAALFLVACHPDGAVLPHSGRDLYASCDSCHGDMGEGKQNIGAPVIAGLPKWYVVAQLRKFRGGARGAHPDDYEGLRMRPMSRQLANEGEIDAVADYISKMPKPHTQRTFTLAGANIQQGVSAYAVCAACHGPNAAGNQQLNAPPLAGQADWYLVTQLRKFRAGIRGTNPADITGGQMRPMSLTLADDQAVKNVVGQIMTFTP